MKNQMQFSSRISIAIFLSAVPLCAGSAPGIRNFDQVDAHVYRGGQPTSEGFQYLAKLGVKTVIDLRETGERSRQEERIVTAAGMKYVSVPMSGLTAPTEAETSKILSILEDSSSGPVFVHCMRGADRTGAVIAAYHIDHDQWSNDRALQDARAHSMSFFQYPRQSYIRNFRGRPVEAKTPAAAAPSRPAAAAAPTPAAAAAPTPAATAAPTPAAAAAPVATVVP